MEPGFEHNGREREGRGRTQTPKDAIGRPWTQWDARRPGTDQAVSVPLMWRPIGVNVHTSILWEVPLSRSGSLLHTRYLVLLRCFLLRFTLVVDFDVPEWIEFFPCEFCVWILFQCVVPKSSAFLFCRYRPHFTLCVCFSATDHRPTDLLLGLSLSVGCSGWLSDRDLRNRQNSETLVSSFRFVGQGASQLGKFKTMFEFRRRFVSCS